MKRILITGGAGFIGSALIKELQQQAYEIFVIDDLSFGSRNFIDIKNANFYKISLLEYEGIKKIISRLNPQYVVHLAAIHFIPYCNKNPLIAVNVNIKGTINLLDSLRGLRNLKKLFFASSAAVYPVYEKALKETCRPNPIDIYGLTKLTGEYLCREFYLRTKTPTIICRFFNAFGPNETNPHLIPEIQKQVNAGKRIIKLGNLTPKRDFIHTFDMAQSVRLLLEKFRRGVDVFNLGSGSEYSVVEIVRAFERQVGEEIKIEVDSARVRRTERMHLLADISKLRKFINWTPQIGIDEGIKTLVEPKR